MNTDNYYTYSTIRNKGNKGYTVMFKKIRDLKKCYICQSENKTKYELEHYFPVCMSGSALKEENLRCVCVDCHKEKTQIDLIIVRFMAKNKILIRNGQVSYHSLLDFNKLEEIYLYLFPILKRAKIKNEYKNNLSLTQQMRYHNE